MSPIHGSLSLIWSTPERGNGEKVLNQWELWDCLERFADIGKALFWVIHSGLFRFVLDIKIGWQT